MCDEVFTQTQWQIEQCLGDLIEFYEAVQQTAENPRDQQEARRRIDTLESIERDVEYLCGGDDN